jgi:hypothetical protein
VRRGRRRMLVTAVAAAASVALPLVGAPTAAADPPFPSSCPTYPSEHGPQEICSAGVRSFDNSHLDVDVTKPFNDRGRQQHPLIVMLNGFTNTKHEWESLTDEADNADKWHWNSHWFARHGYYVLTYTPRGFCHKQPEEPPPPEGATVHKECQPEGAHADWRPETPSNFTSRDQPSGTIQLKTREAEIRDTQWLAALAAASFPGIDPERVAVTGGSYGGGESWTQASQATWNFPANCTQPEDRPSECPPLSQMPDVGRLPSLKLQAAIPKYPWTDLAYSLAPNGHPRPVSRQEFEEFAGDDGPLFRPFGEPIVCRPPASPGDDPYYEASQGCAESDSGDGNPVGVVKHSFVNSLYALGALRGTFEQGFRSVATARDEGAINVNCWKARAAGPPFEALGAPNPALPPCQPSGDPYDVAGVEDPIVRQLRRGLTEFRSAYYQDKEWAKQCGPDFAAGRTDVCDPDERKVAIFSIQGWTDDLFPAVESFRMFKYLKRLAPRWPIEVAVADVGHQRAQNKPKTWQRLNDQAWQFLEAHIQGSHEQETIVSSEPTVCPADPNQVATQRLTAATPEGLANGKLHVDYDAPGTIINPAGAADPRGTRTDPIAGEGGCQETGPDPPLEQGVKYSRLSAPLDRTETYVGLGAVELPGIVIPANTATVNVRVWDKPPQGPERLVTRGTYRYDAAYDPESPIVLRVPLFGNHFTFDPGNQIRLEVTLVDSPFLLPSNVASTVTFQPPTLTLPTRQASERTLGP